MLSTSLHRWMLLFKLLSTLRLPHRNDTKIAEICNLWAFWPVIQPKFNEKPFCPTRTEKGYRNSTPGVLWSVGQKCLFLDSEKIVYWLNYRPKGVEVADFCYFGIIPIR